MIKIDMEKGQVMIERDGTEQVYPMATQEAFSIISEAWLRCGWDNKYVYSFSWLGRPIIQLPEDMFRTQEVIYELKPDVIIETGVAHGGSLFFYAGILKAIGRGRVIGVDVEIRSHNRKAIEGHDNFEGITLIEGSSTDPNTVAAVQSLVKPTDKVLVILDSNHTKQHVLDELNLYSSMVSVGSYIVAADGIMENLAGAPRSNEDWAWNNPKAAAEEFVKSNPKFSIVEPRFPFNEGNIQQRVSYWPSAWIRRNE